MLRICPDCYENDWIVTRKHTVWETVSLTITNDDGDYAETEPAQFGDTIRTGDWQVMTCNICGKEVNPTDYLG